MGLFFPSTKKISSSVGSAPIGGHIHDTSPGRISGKELGYVERELIGKLGRHKAAEVTEMLQGSLGQDHHFGAKGIRSDEVKETLHRMEENHDDGIAPGDVAKIREVLDERL